MQKIASQRKSWTQEEDELLSELKSSKQFDWVEIARRIEGRNPSQCLQRWKRIKGFKSRRTWSEEENHKILELVKIHGYNWGIISTNLVQRTCKQVKEHYLNHLDPQIKRDPWTQEEDLKVVSLYNSLGGKWHMVAKQLKGRSENCIKNRFYSCLRHKYLNVKHPYYQIPEKKAKLNDEESQKNAIPDTKPHKELQNQQCLASYTSEKILQNEQQSLDNQPIYQHCIYQYPIFVQQPILMPVYYYTPTLHNYSNSQ